MQVLLISTVISLLALYFVGGSRDQINSARLLLDRTEAEVALYSGRNRLLFSLLTQELHSTQSDDDPLVNHWRFDNLAFALNPQVTAQIQDQAGLVNMVVINRAALQALLQQQLGDAIDSTALVDKIMDWKDHDHRPRPQGSESATVPVGPRNGTIMFANELRFIDGLSQTQLQAIASNLTFNGTDYFNVAAAPDSVIMSRFGEHAPALIALKKQRQLNQATFFSTTGNSADTNITFTPSGNLAVTLQAEKGDALVSQTWQIKLQATKDKPYLVLRRE